MTRAQASSRRRPRLLLLALLVVLGLSGCATTERGVAMSREAVTPITVGQATPVGADELAEAMLRAGFDRDQILDIGPAIRNALATSGGAQVRDDSSVEALFAVHSGRLYVTSRSRGNFIQELPGASAANGGG
ncbi:MULTISPECIES: hypothetical protein [Halorhodospira]|uniref:hypothetical protein n=1 Tax=Halorhodospira TaxID=85108 RepID=UPI001EE8C896|nr:MULTISPECIES: hypothetical protein [Halorhodospira]MCG5527336.1 hypothetical protein [Halorhodospira halophila]MCG5543670.1 hypothetical protein [Halorhodospira sp. 9628]